MKEQLGRKKELALEPNSRLFEFHSAKKLHPDSKYDLVVEMKDSI